MQQDRSSKLTSKVLQSAIRYLNYRSRSSQEIIRHIRSKYPHIKDELLNITINRLTELGLINDTEFAENWLISKVKKGYGPIYVKKQLLSFGVEKDIINQVISKFSPTLLLESAHEIIKRKKSLFNKLNKQQYRNKTYRYLYNRGYTSTTINQVIDDIMT